jgi:hypothetical protein
MTTNMDVVPVLITLGHTDQGGIYLRFPPQYGNEIAALLDEYGIEHGTAAEFSAGPSDWIEFVRVFTLIGATGVASTPALSGLAKVITAFVRRHDGKSFRFERDGEVVDSAGYSEKALERILSKLPERQAALDAATREAMGLTDDE